MNNFMISTDQNRLQVDRIHHFLSNHAYWCKGIPRETLEKAIENSLNFGVYTPGYKEQIGYARVVTDKTTFAWLCDVYIEEACRGHGLSKRLIEAVVTHKDLQGLRRFCLATNDAHTLYERFGFIITETPQSWMEKKNNQIYLG